MTNSRATRSARRRCLWRWAQGVATSLALPLAASAATITPTTTADEFDLVANASCSLREAVESANQNSDFGGCVAVGVYGSDLIELAAGTYVLELGPPEFTFGIDNSVGDLDVDPAGIERLDVVGQTAADTVIERSDAADDFRILDTGFSALVRLADLTVRNGSELYEGGGIASYGLELTLEGVIVRDNVAFSAEQTLGGGIFAFTEVVSIVDSHVLDNRVELSPAALTRGVGGGECFAGSAGGGIFAFVLGAFLDGPEVQGEGNPTRSAARTIASTSFQVERTTFSGNEAVTPSLDCPGLGGGALLVDETFGDPSTVTRVVNSTFSGNEAGYGGGLVIDVVGEGSDLRTDPKWTVRSRGRASLRSAQGGAR